MHVNEVVNKTDQQVRGVGVLPTFLAYAQNPFRKRKMVLIRVLADSGAQISMMKKDVADELGLRPKPVQGVGIGALGGGELTQTRHQASINMCSRFYNKPSQPVTAYVLPELAHKVQSLPVHPYDLYPSVKKLGKELADDWPQEGGVKIDLIIGQDYLWSCYRGRLVEPLEAGCNGASLVDSPFGLILQGWVQWGKGQRPVGPCPQAFTSLRVPKLVDVPTYEKEPQLDQLLRQLWELEAFGIKEPSDDKLTAAQAYAVEFLEKTLVFNEEARKFVVTIPISEKAPLLMSNEGQARMRLMSLRRTLSRDQKKAQLYAEAMQKYLTEGHAELITQEDEESSQVFYLPHSPVFTTGQRGELKTRIVFDCAARDKAGTSLNSIFAVGPVPDADLLRILTSWRSKPHSFNTDVKNCFLNIKLDKSQQNLFRFLWSPEPSAEPKTYKFTSLIFGSSVSPWISSTCLFKCMEQAEEEEPELVRRLRRSLWVDDFLLGVDSVEEGREIIRKMQKIFARASFSLGKFVATSSEILSGLEDEQKLFDTGQRPDVKALGVLWKADDSLGVAADFDEVFKKSAGAETKRTLARAVASVYDPLQLYGPWKIGGMLVLKAVWDLQHEQAAEQKISKTAKKFWDQRLPDDIQTKIASWKANSEKLKDLQVPRCLSDPKRKVIRRELWGFSDASPLAAGAVLYMRTIYKAGTPTCRYVVSKSKINSKNLTLPRMELTGAKFLSRLVASVREYLESEKQMPVYLFSDSEITLHWISKPPESWKQFVANQVRVIRKLTDVNSWYHIPGKDNIADILTRPKSVEELLQAKRQWLEGPDLVRTGKIPPQPNIFEAVKEENLEEKVAEVDAVLTASIQERTNAVIADWTEKCSDVVKLLRRVALVRRAMAKLFHKFTHHRYPERFRKEADRTGKLFADQEEKQEAYGELVRVIQSRHFQDELQLVAKGQPVGSKSRLKELRPFIDSRGLLRAQGRIEGASAVDLPYGWLFPLILPSDDELLGRIILDLHYCNHHLGVDSMHAELRQSFWILRARATIRRYKNRCLRCRRYDGAKVEPSIAPIPKERMDVYGRPFKHIALDGMGPLQVESERGPPKKTWILVFTCLVTRAINLEILKDLTTESFVTALRLHIGVYGEPVSVRLDNLASHVKLSQEVKALKNKWLMAEWEEALSKRGITFSFSRVGQPSTNGIVERMVRTAKSCLAKTLHRKKVDREELNVLLKEASSLINNRPLLQVHQGDTEDHLAVTPNHLIFGHRLPALPLASDCNMDGRESLSKLWEKRQRLRHQFTTLFIDGYLSELRRQKKWSKATEDIKVGDLVVVSDPSAKRRDWPIAVVCAAESSKADSVVRTVRLRLADKYVTRSVRSLVFLRHLPDYQPEQGKECEFYNGDQQDPPRDKKLRFVKNKQADAQRSEKGASPPSC